MASGPPKLLETLARLLVPPACREEVLGDLHERYKTPLQYLGDLFSILPFLVMRRILRTTDPQLFLTDALLVYGSFLAAAWYKDRLADGSSLLHLAIPAGLTLLYLVLNEALVVSRWSAFVVNVVWLAVFLSSGLTSQTNIFGFFSGLLLDAAIRILYRRTAGTRESAAGAPLVMGQSSGRGAMSRTAKLAQDAGITVLVLAIAAGLIVVMPRSVYLVIVLLAWVAGYRFLKRR
ncbi:MAG TPA: hypothetical protein VK789_04045 [Bryobacteraceae bacterium]|nr:hypothetical protein [Bryobacteraceae bacterium]